jgi:hypothetical protein
VGTKYTGQELEEHLGYEIDMLNHSYKMLPQIKAYLKKAGADDRTQTLTLYALMNDFCIHARQLIEFFTKDKTNSASAFATSAY